MNCTRCRKKYGQDVSRCPHCGEPNPEMSGVMQTSIVRISTASEDLIFRSVDEAPARLRGKLLRSINGSNSATILIADRRGRKQVAKALRALPAPAQKRLMHTALSRRQALAARLLTPSRKRAILALLLLLVLALIFAIFRLRA